MTELAQLHPAAQVAVPLAIAFTFVGFWHVLFKFME